MQTLLETGCRASEFVGLRISRSVSFAERLVRQIREHRGERAAAFASDLFTNRAT